MYRHYLTTTDGRVLHLNLDTGEVSDGYGRACNGNTEGYLGGGRYKRMTIGTLNELRRQPLNPVQFQD